MTNMKLADEVLKNDVLGRVRTPKGRREALLEEFERSGVSGKKFAKLVGVNYQTFASWVQQRRKVLGEYPMVAGQTKGTGSVRKCEPLRLVEAVLDGGGCLEKAAPGARLRVELPGGAWVEMGDVGQARLVAELLRTLMARPC